MRGEIAEPRAARLREPVVRADEPAAHTAAQPPVAWAGHLDPADRLQFERFHQWLRLSFAPAPLLVVLAHGSPALPQAIATGAGILLSYAWVELLLRRWPDVLLRWQLALRVFDCAIAYFVLFSIHAFLGDAYYDAVYILFTSAAAATHGYRGVAVASTTGALASGLGRAHLIAIGVMPFELRHVTDVIFYATFFAMVGAAVAFLMRRSAQVVERREAGWRETLADRNAALERAATELRATNRELEAFAYSVSHDLRQPLRAIDGFSQILLNTQGDALDAKGKEYLSRVRAASQRMGQLIDDLLQLSRVTRAEMKREPIDLSALATEIVADLRKNDPERSVEVAIAPGVRAHGDPRLLRVALENLLGNAWKFTANREVAHLSFDAERRDGRPVYVVRDDGAGFDMAYADKLFGAFQRLHTSSEFDGTGVGLATVQRIVHRHGGRIWAEAEVDQGAAFHFTLGGKG